MASKTHTIDTAPPPLTSATPLTTSVIRPAVVENHEPTAADGYYRGTVTNCQSESNVPEAAPKLCVDLGASIVSAAVTSRVDVLVAGWYKHIPLYAGDLIRFEVRGGHLASAELLSYPHGR